MLGLIYSGASVLLTMLVVVLYAVQVVPALSQESLATADMLKLALGAPMTGCCPTVWAVVLLGVLSSSAPADGS